MRKCLIRHVLLSQRKNLLRALLAGDGVENPQLSNKYEFNSIFSAWFVSRLRKIPANVSEYILFYLFQVRSVFLTFKKMDEAMQHLQSNPFYNKYAQKIEKIKELVNCFYYEL